MPTAVEAFKELIDKYDENRTRWLNKYGNDIGFDQWFTEQVVGK